MKRAKWRLAVLGGAALLLGTAVAHAQVPRTINFQGRLANKSLQPVTGTYSITVSLWTTSAVGTGTSCFSEVSSVAVNSGLFNIVIGGATSGGIATACDFSVPYYLQLQVAGDTAMSPRVPLSAAPYALNADRLDNLEATAFQQQNATTGDVYVTGKVGVGMTAVQKLDVSGYVKGTGLCIGTDCRTAWSTGTVTSITAGTGITLSPSPITSTGTVSVNTTTMQKRITGTCTTTQGMQTVAANGTVTCLTVSTTNPPCTWKGKTYSGGATCYTGWAQGTYCISGKYDYTRCTCNSNGSWSCSDVSCSTLPVSCGS
jgi:hypothetical protein